MEGRIAEPRWHHASVLGPDNNTLGACVAPKGSHCIHKPSAAPEADSLVMVQHQRGDIAHPHLDRWVVAPAVGMVEAVNDLEGLDPLFAQAAIVEAIEGLAEVGEG